MGRAVPRKRSRLRVGNSILNRGSNPNSGINPCRIRDGVAARVGPHLALHRAMAHAASRLLFLFAAVHATACGPNSTPQHAIDSGLTGDCFEGQTICQESQLYACSASGDFEPTDDPDGICAGCNLADNSYIGCKYFPTVTMNNMLQALSPFDFALTVSNSGSTTAQVSISGGALTSSRSFAVEPGAVRVENLPWVDELARPQFVSIEGTDYADGHPVHAKGKAYFLNSDQPVTVYQFNPLDYKIGDSYSYTNDASLLYPVNALSNRYVVASYPGTVMYDHPESMPTLFMTSPGGIAITAVQDATTVTVTPTADVAAADGIPAMPAGVPTTFTMHRADVVQFGPDASDGNPGENEPDLTGTLIESSAPIQVLGFNNCTFVPKDIAACDHLEESMLPFQALGAEYFIATPARPMLGDTTAVQDRIVRIVAVEPGTTTLSYEPAIPGAPTTLAGIGKFAELPPLSSSHRISSNNKILIAEYMVGQAYGWGDTGDPAMAVAVPQEQYRNNYMFHAPTNYEINYVNITAPTGSTIVLDGAVVSASAFQPIGASGYGIARVQLAANGGGNHVLTADNKVGISVYGYGQYTSYWYPGGLDLELIEVP